MSEDVEKRVPYLAERYFLENNLSRVQYIAGIVQDNINRGENSLILVHSIAFGRILKEQFEHFLSDYSTIEHIYGDVDIKTREEAKKSMENSTKKVIVATISIFSTGISIKNLHSVILATSTKSKIAVLQSIGRSLRLHKSKDCAIVYDIVDDLKYSQNHAKERQNYYINEKFEVEFKEIEIS
jgi:superfamily II DNA or RNA helicase